ncbi:hypothetical protein HMPREF9123_1376 [Neisseria bacilliformis ATCC BAA-1200]|uniref:Uncharacterized protein n=1 Tax=Neisseria bacilliformis ATCC BAA-1200 TaxID=888742 RepID=F2BCE8_9NEIS|nr:hypothetical protein HMPREF9123_1376 [Neisseria bacilliformis ATCC BAA-1200]
MPDKTSAKLKLSGINVRPTRARKPVFGYAEAVFSDGLLRKFSLKNSRPSEN